MWNYLACYSVVHSIICGYITAESCLAWKNHMLLHDKIESCANVKKNVASKVILFAKYYGIARRLCHELILFDLTSCMKQWFTPTRYLE
jgi:hypothetical protein